MGAKEKTGQQFILGHDPEIQRYWTEAATLLWLVFRWLVVMRLLKHREEQFSHRTLHGQKGKKGGKTEAGRGDSTETKLGPSEMKEKKEVGGKTERLKERGSVQVMDTQRQREKQRERERTCPQRI